MVKRKLNTVDTFKKIQQLALPVAAALIVATGWQVRTEMELSTHENAIEALECKDNCFSSVGPDGFLDPENHVAHDRHIIHWHRDVFGTRGFLRLMSDYSTVDNGGR